MAVLSDEEIDRLSTQSTAQSSVLSDADIDRLSGEKPKGPSMPVGLARMGIQGLTFSTGDEIEAGLRTGFGYLGDYGKTVKDIRASNDAFGKENPIAATAAEIAGSLPTAWVPGMGQAGVARAAATGGMRALAHESGKMGLKMAAAHGAGKGEGDTVGESVVNRAVGAATHAPLGYGVGAVAGPVVDKVAQWGGRAFNAARNVGAEGSNPALNAARTARGALERDQTTPDALLTAVLPTYNRGAMPQQQVESILSLYGQGLGQGLDDLAARQVAVANLVQGGTNPNTAANQVREVVRRYHDMHQIPMQLHELPALNAGSEGAQSNIAMRVAANRVNQQADPFRASVRERQIGLGENMEDIVATALGGRNGDEMMIAARAANKARNRATYGPAEQADEAARVAVGMPTTNQPGSIVPGAGGNLPAPTPGVQPIDITPDIVAMSMRYTDRAGPIATKMREAINLFMDPNTPNTGVRTLRQFIDQKMELDHLIESSMKPGPGGTPQGTTLTGELVKFKKDLMARVSQQNPLYAQANAEAARGFSDMRAAELARDLSLRAGPKASRALREFHNASPEAQDMMRVMFAQNVADKIVNTPRTGNVGKFFNTPASRRMVIEILGEREGNALLAHADRIALASRTHHQLNGQSQTAPLQQAIKDMDIGEVVRQMINFATPSKILENLGNLTARTINSKRDAEALKLWGASTERPDQLIEALRRLQQTQMPSSLPPPNTAPYAAPFGAVAGQQLVE